MLSFLSKFEHKREMRESKDEILVGEYILAMAKLGCPVIGFYAGDDRQAVKFKPVGDQVLHSITIILDRKTGDSKLQEMLIGSKATLTIQAEVKNYLADPDDLIHMYRTDLQNLFKMPILGGIRLDHQLNSVLATTTHIIDIDTYILKGEESSARLQQLLSNTFAQLREKLAPYKKARPTASPPPPPPPQTAQPAAPGDSAPSGGGGLFSRFGGGKTQ